MMAVTMCDVGVLRYECVIELAGEQLAEIEWWSSMSCAQ